jgi:DNA mismatch repair protein MutS
MEMVYGMNLIKDCDYNSTGNLLPITNCKMQADKTTIADLSIFNADEDQSVFHLLNHTQTNQGRDYLYQILNQPLDSIDAINDVQNTIQQLQLLVTEFPITINNGTIMVIEKFYDTPLDAYPEKPGVIDSFFYKIFNSYDYSLTKYSVTYFIAFLQGMQKIKQLLENKKGSKLQLWYSKIDFLLTKPAIQKILNIDKKQVLQPAEILTHAGYLKNHFKHDCFELIDIYSRLDAYSSLAIACKKNNFIFPQFVETQQPFIEASNVFHPLLKQPVSYTIQLNKNNNFLFLTGANMAGKSTFIKATGICVYLAHIGMGVPAKKMQLSLFDGLLSNIHVMDNIIKGESYFFNEVQRIKSTVEKISDGKKWLILIDELFKGTNVQDAMKCSTTVIEGLHKMNNALFVLSTHLYEIAQDLKQYSNIQFRYFETEVKDDQLIFSYHLKEGISNDRLGYLILKKEGVVDLLKQL